MDISIHYDGPFFTGARGRVMAELAEDIAFEVGNAALERWQFQLDKNIRNPTPYYETQIIQQHHGGNEVVHDRGIIYGPWLEGTSSRNSRTRFKGYHSARKAKQEVEQQVPAIAQRVVARAIGRLQ